MCVFVGGLDSVEYYDIASNEWRTASPMPWRGVTVKCAAVGDVIYVLAGFQGVGRLGHVLEYHTDTDRSVKLITTPQRDAHSVKIQLYHHNLKLSSSRLFHSDSKSVFFSVFRWVTCSKVRAFPITSCLICVVDTCGVNEDEDMDLIDSQSHAAPTAPPSASASSTS